MRSFLRQSVFSYKGTYGYYDPKTYFMTKVMGPIFQILVYVTTVGYALDTNNLAYFIIGNAMLLCSLNAISGVGTVIRIERNYGTLMTIMASPESKLKIFLSKTFVHIFDGFLNVVIGLIAGSLIFKADFSAVNIPIFSLSIIVTVFATTGLGFLIGTAGLITRDVLMLYNTIRSMLLIFTGVNYAVENLPELLQPISYMLPMTRGIEASRAIFSGATLNEVSSLLVGELSLGVVYFLVGLIMLNRMEKVSIQNGKLDLF